MFEKPNTVTVGILTSEGEIGIMEITGMPSFAAMRLPTDEEIEEFISNELGASNFHWQRLTNTTVQRTEKKWKWANEY